VIDNLSKMYSFSIRCIDLKGRCVLPWFIDTHAQMDRDGLKGLFPSLDGAQSVPEIVAHIAAEVAKKPSGAWLVTAPLGTPPYHFDVAAMLAEKRVPTRWDLDAVSPENPVYIQAIWGYWGWPPLVSVLNSRALESCGINRHTPPAWEGMEILKDRQGEPTGIILEHHFVPTLECTLLEQAPRITIEQRAMGLVVSMQRYTAAGTTSIYEGHGVDPDLMLAYKQLWEQGTMRVRAHLLFTPPSLPRQEFQQQVEDWARLASGQGIGDEWLRVGGISFQLSGDRTVAELRRRWKRGKRHLTPKGRHQIDYVTPMQDLFDRDIPVTIETDGSPISPLHALWVVLARRERETGEVIAPRQQISRQEALRAYTAHGAYLTFEEAKKGSIEAGKWADVVVLEEDLLTISVDHVKDIPVHMTIVGGQIMHEVV
jgi:predicted amidohydrolase YtcJ